LELGRQLALLGDRREDGPAPLLELEPVGAALLDRPDLDLVEPAGPLLAVAGDERNGVALGEQLDDRPDRKGRQVELASQVRNGIVGRRGGGGGGRFEIGHGRPDGVKGRDRSCVPRCMQRPCALSRWGGGWYAAGPQRRGLTMTLTPDVASLIQ